MRRRRTDDAATTKASNGRSTLDGEAVGSLTSRLATSALSHVVKTNASKVSKVTGNNGASALVLGANVGEDELLSGTTGTLRRTDLARSIGEGRRGSDLAGSASLGEGRGGGRDRDGVDGDGGRVPALVSRGSVVVVNRGGTVTVGVVVDARGGRSRVRGRGSGRGGGRGSDLDGGRAPVRVGRRSTVRGRRVGRDVVVLVRVRGGRGRRSVTRVRGGVSGVRVTGSGRSRGGGSRRRAVERRRGSDLDGDGRSGSPGGRRTDLAGTGGVESSRGTDDLALLEVDAGSSGGKEEALWTRRAGSVRILWNQSRGRTYVVADNGAGDLVGVSLGDAEVVGVGGAADGVAVSGGSASSEVGVESVLRKRRRGSVRWPKTA